MNSHTMRRSIAVGLLGMALGACDDLLTVSDPQRYTSEYLDESLGAVAAGIEGDLYVAMDNLVNATSLNSDEMQHTGTWIGYDDLDHGRFRYGNASGGGGMGSGDNVMDALLRTRSFAISGQERFERVLGAEAATSPMMAVAKTVEGWTDLLLAQNFCEAPAEAAGPAVPDAELIQQAIVGLTSGLETAQAAGALDVANWARAGRARANLLAGNYDAAAADASAVPDGFEWLASYSSNSGRQYNGIVQLSTAGFNRASGVREFYWDRVDTDADAMLDPYTGEPDPRLPVLFEGAVGVDGVTPHYSQWKYRELGADIQLTDSKEMRLIEAEVAWRRGDLATAVDILNAIRADAGLGPHPATPDADLVFEYLLYERFAEMFLEGQRMSDLHRFELVGDLIDAGAFGSATDDPRPTKFPISELEVRNNPEIEKSDAARCLPMSR